jgi:hypothetical protein
VDWYTATAETIVPIMAMPVMIPTVTVKVVESIHPRMPRP